MANRTHVDETAALESRELTPKELAGVAGGSITQVNGGGNTPRGQANGVPYENPAGNVPPGQNA